MIMGQMLPFFCVSRHLDRKFGLMSDSSLEGIFTEEDLCENKRLVELFDSVVIPVIGTER